MTTGGQASVDDLRAVPDLAGLPDEVLAWLAAKGEVIEVVAAERIFNPGEPAEHLFIVLSGAIQVFTPVGGQFLLFDTFEKGRISGTLPFSRLTHFPGYMAALAPSRVFRLRKLLFPEMLQRSPELGQRLVAIMSDRVRDSTKTQQQREKLAALGKLSAGLAHELNNPAAAVRRSAASLAERFESLPPLVVEMIKSGVPEQSLMAARAVLDEVRARPRPSLSPLERSAREDEVSDWLEEHEVARGWEAAETLVDAGFAPADLDALAGSVGQKGIPPLLGWLAASIDAKRLIGEVVSAAGRISELVASVKSYSHLGGASVLQPTDVREGIDSTLIMLGHELKAKDVRVVREDAPDLPTVMAQPGELNQVWTNLIDNAVDALPPGGELRIETAREAEQVVVRVIDNGSGISEDVQSRIFEPFFTTKEVGEGMGLGLDITQRIVRLHSGQIAVESRPGRTVFTVRLPLASHAQGPPGAPRGHPDSG